MLSRRLLRVKVMQAVNIFHKNDDMTLQQAEKNMFYSIYKSYELYHLLLLLLVDIQAFASNKIEKGKSKILPTPEELEPNTHFIENKALIKLSKNQTLLKFVEHKGLSWVNHREIIKSLYKEICDSEFYQEYMKMGKTDFETDRNFLVKITEKVIAQYEPLYSNLEEQSIFWNDESEYIMSMVIKTLRDFKSNDENNKELMPEFREEEDKTFISTLLRKSIIYHKETSELIKKYLKNWELERISFMDIVLIEIALAEMTEFSDISLKVTLNEYIEISKYYSTPKSGYFINGVLEKIINEYKEAGKIKKISEKLLELN